MISASVDHFLKQFPQAITQKPLAPLTSMRIGGPADLYYQVQNIEELPQLLNAAHKLQLPVFMLGGGSNIIFADEGFRGLVIHLKARKIELVQPGAADQNSAESLPRPAKRGVYDAQTFLAAKDVPAGHVLIAAEAGALLSQVIQFALRHDLIGMEKMMGLPGTIGGAVRGNAGAFGTEISQLFAKAVILEDGQLKEVGPEYFEFQYRFSCIKKTQEPILKVFLRLRHDPVQAKLALAEAMTIVKNRISKQPKGYCSGSFFKNPGGGPAEPTGHDPHLKAGYLLEQVGAKGLQVGGIKVSEQHANWLINVGSHDEAVGAHKTSTKSPGGTQKDVLKLMRLLQQKVRNRFNIELEPEVEIVNP